MKKKTLIFRNFTLKVFPASKNKLNFFQRGTLPRTKLHYRAARGPCSASTPPSSATTGTSTFWPVTPPTVAFADRVVREFP